MKMQNTPGSLLFAASFALLSLAVCSGDALAAEFYINRSSCGKVSTCFIDCHIVDKAQLWLLEEHDAPSLSPGEALLRAKAEVASQTPVASDVYAESISLTRCDVGWVYVVRFSASFRCRESGQTDYGTVAVGVFMDGVVFLPPADCDVDTQVVSIPRSCEFRSPATND